MTIPSKVLSQEQIEWAKSPGKSCREISSKLGIGKDRAAKIKKAKTIEAAMVYAGKLRQEEPPPPDPETPPQEPPPPDIPQGTGTRTGTRTGTTGTGTGGNLPPSKTPIQLTPRTVVELDIIKEKLILYPEDLMRCLDEFRDMQHLIGWQGDFSSALREGMKILRALMVHLSEGGNDDGREEGLSDGRVEEDGVAAAS